MAEKFLEDITTKLNLFKSTKSPEELLSSIDSYLSSFILTSLPQLESKNSIDDSISHHLKGQEKKFQENWSQKLKDLDSERANLKREIKNIYPFLNHQRIGIKFIEPMSSLLNPILVLLSQTRAIAGYYLNPDREDKILLKSRNNPNYIYLSPVFFSLVKDLWKNTQLKIYDPTLFYQSFRQLYTFERLDIKTASFGSVLGFILKKLHEDLNNDETNKLVLEQNEFWPERQWNKYKEHINKKYTTRIGIQFYSTYQKESKCSNCLNNFPVYFEPVPIINIYVEQPSYSNAELYDLDLQSQYSTLINSKNFGTVKRNCPICGREQVFYLTQKIIVPASSLVINIDRSLDPNNNMKLKYGMELKITWGLENEAKVDSFELKGVVIKKNGGGGGVRYLTYMKSFIDEKWFCYDNEKVTMVNNVNEIFDERFSYVLFYEKKVNQE